MEEKNSELKVAKGIRELMQRRSITNTEAYLAYMEEQKETKRKKSEARMQEAEVELSAIRKMRRGEL